MSETRRFDSLERVVRDTRRLLDDTATTVLARLGTHTHSGGGGATPDATTTVKGILQLAGDLSGTASLPTVPGLDGKAATGHTHPATADATTAAKGVVQLAGDLAGTAALPTVPGLAGKAPLGLDSEEAYVGTLQSTTSTVYTNLTTVGPTCVVTLATARRVLIFLKAILYQTTTTQNRVLMSVAGTGATVAAAGDAAAVIHNGSGQAESYAGIVYLDCAAGTTTFTAKYRVAGGTGQFQDRFMVVIPV